jgi:hypothetical protein
MTINFNPNLPPGDAPSEELVVQKLGGLVLADPEAFDEQPTHTNVGASWNAQAWDSIFDTEDEEDEENED